MLSVIGDNVAETRLGFTAAKGMMEVAVVASQTLKCPSVWLYVKVSLHHQDLDAVGHPVLTRRVT